MKSFLIKIPFLANDVDIASGYLTGGLPSMTSIDGLMHLMERNFKKIDGLNLSVLDWSFFIDNITYNEGKHRYIGYIKSEKRKNLINTPGREDKYATIKGFFVVNVTHNESFDLKLLRQKDELVPIFNRLRLSGGALWIDPTKDETIDSKLYKNKHKISFFEYIDKKSSAEQFLKILKSADSHSFVIQDRTSLLEDKAKNSLEKAVELFSYSRNEQSDIEADIKLFNAITDDMEDDELFLMNLELVLARDIEFFNEFHNIAIRNLSLEIDPKIKETAEKPNKNVKDVLLPSLRSLSSKLEVMRNKFGLSLTKQSFEEKYIKLFSSKFESDLNLVEEFLIPVNIGYHAISERKNEKA